MFCFTEEGKGGTSDDFRLSPFEQFRSALVFVFLFSPLSFFCDCENKVKDLIQVIRGYSCKDLWPIHNQFSEFRHEMSTGILPGFDFDSMKSIGNWIWNVSCREVALGEGSAH
jgi:hypothetical protein